MAGLIQRRYLPPVHGNIPVPIGHVCLSGVVIEYRRNFPVHSVLV